MLCVQFSLALTQTVEQLVIGRASAARAECNPMKPVSLNIAAVSRLRIPKTHTEAFSSSLKSEFIILPRFLIVGLA